MFCCMRVLFLGLNTLYAQLSKRLVHNFFICVLLYYYNIDVHFIVFGCSC